MGMKSARQQTERNPLHNNSVMGINKAIHGIHLPRAAAGLNVTITTVTRCMKEAKMRHAIAILFGILFLSLTCHAEEQDSALDTITCGKETIQGECLSMSRYELIVRVEGWEKTLQPQEVDAITFAAPSRMGIWGDKKKNSGILKILSYNGKKNEFIAEGESKPFDMDKDNWIVFGPTYRQSVCCAIKGFKPDVFGCDEMALTLVALGTAYGKTFEYKAVSSTLDTGGSAYADRIATVLHDLPASLHSPQRMSYCTLQEKSAYMIRLLSALSDNRPAIINLHNSDSPKSGNTFKMVVGFDLEKMKILVLNYKCFFEANTEPRRIDIDKLAGRVAIRSGETWFLELEQPVPNAEAGAK